MNGESAFTGASIQDVNGRATDSELAGNSRKVSSAGILQRLRHEPADRRGAWRQWLFGAQELCRSADSDCNRTRAAGCSLTVGDGELRFECAGLPVHMRANA